MRSDGGLLIPGYDVCKADERELTLTVLPERLEHCSLHQGATSSIEDRCRGNLTK